MQPAIIRRLPLLSPLAIFLLVELFGAHMAFAQDTFDIHALETSGPRTNVDISQFSGAGDQAAGIYHVDIIVNNQPVDTRDIHFVQGKTQLIPELTPAMLTSFGVKIASVPALAKLPADQKITDELEHYIALATTRFDFSRQTLNITIPQAVMNNLSRDEVDPKFWDEGVTALVMGYNFNGSNSWEEDQDNARDDSYFLNLRSGLNFGAWRLRNYSTWSYSRTTQHNEDNEQTGDISSHVNDSDDGGSHWDSINTFLQRDIPVLKAQMDVGDTTTPSDVFDGFQFRGAQLATDDQMLPDSQRNFAPTVRGIANSNAKVTIRQNNTIIYESYVPPGAFAITDLYPNSTNGDLNITVTEADGSEHVFTQAFSSVAIMQREGHVKYAVSGGKYLSNAGGSEPEFGQVSAIYGLSHNLTLYGGIQGSDDYKSALIGGGVSLWDLGAVSVDLTEANAQLTDDDSKNGQSMRIQYSKSMLETGSTLTLAAYRYSTKGFYTFQEANDLRSDYYNNDKNENDEEEQDRYNMEHNKRSRMQADISQNLMGGDWGSLYLSGYQQDYWDGDGYERSLNVGYNGSVNGISYGLTYSYTTTPGSDANKTVAFNVSVPLSKWLPQAWVGYNVNSTKNGSTTQQTNLYGTALADNNLSYNLTEGYGSSGIGNSGNTSLDYKGTYGEVNGGYNYTPDNHRVNYGVQGGIVVHPHGLTFSQPISGDVQSIAIVSAPGLADAKVQNNTGVFTDSRGYAVVPYLSPYRRTTVAIDTETMGDNGDIETNTSQVVPTAGAVVMAKFKTHIGARVLMTLQHGQDAVPFGSTATLIGDDGNASIVGDDGETYLSGMPTSGTVFVKWGTQSNEQCKAPYRLPTAPDKNKAAGVISLTAICS